MRSFLTSFALALTVAPKGIESFYVPGVAVKTFTQGEPVELKVNAITSIHTQIPRSFYSLPVCKPASGVKNKSENLGEFLTGNKIQNSPIEIRMLQDDFCRILCQTKPLSEKSAKTLDLAIRYEYHNNWIVDNLPSFSIGHTPNGAEGKRFGGGFPLGAYLQTAVKTKSKKAMRKKYKKISKDKNGIAYVYNHYKIVLEYHQPDKSVTGFRIVGFGVEPMSINHSFAGGYKWDGVDSEGIKVPLTTCDENKSKAERHHLSVGEIHADGQRVKQGETILYTYDVVWRPSATTWATRWDVYMHEADNGSKGLHWLSIGNSMFVVVFMGVFVAAILVRNLKNEISGYNALIIDDDLEDLNMDVEENAGWKLIHSDVFRPPTHQPMFFCVSVGSGMQILLTSLFTLVLACMGLLSPARRGSLVTCLMVLFMLSGIVAGYCSARLYKAFRGRAWQMCTIFTAALFPGIVFALFLFINTYTAFVHSSLSIPFLDVLIVTVMFCGVQIPLVFLGAFFGYKQGTVEFPTKTSTVARAIPEMPFYFNPIAIMCLTGLIPFSSSFLELSYVLEGVWSGEFYYIFGYLTIVSVVMMLVAIEACILAVYWQFVNENHRWWWYSFISGGSIGLYLFLYCISYFNYLQTSSMFLTYILYFGYSFLMCVGLFLAVGSVCAMSSLYFTMKIFGSIKVD